MKNDVDPIEEAFATALRVKRRELGISQEELAHRAGVSMRYISMLERNINQPSLVKLNNIAKGLEITLVEFVQSIQDCLQPPTD